MNAFCKVAMAATAVALFAPPLYGQSFHLGLRGGAGFAGNYKSPTPGSQPGNCLGDLTVEIRMSFSGCKIGASDCAIMPPNDEPPKMKGAVVSILLTILLR